MSTLTRTDDLNVVTWNLRWNAGRAAVEREAEILELCDWDVAMLQEVNQKAWAALSARGLTDGGVYALGSGMVEPTSWRSHGAALLVRNGIRLTAPELLTGLPVAGRGLGAVIDGWTIPVSVCSWHAPNAASSGPMVKMQGYQGFIDWIVRQEHATVVGFDSNHWEEHSNLDPEPGPGPEHGWSLEYEFFGPNPPHQLRDAFRDYLRRHPDAWEALPKPERGPLATTYIRGSRRNPRPDRFDYIFISDHFVCDGVEHPYEKSTEKPGSDHSLVHARLRLAG